MSVFTFSTTPPFATGVIGTTALLNRAFNNSMALKQGDQALDQIVGAVHAPTVTGTQNNYALPDTCCTINWGGTLDTVFTGFAGGRVGRRVKIFHGGTNGKYIHFSHSDAGSIAANRMFWRTLLGQRIGYFGCVELEYTSGGWVGTLLDPGVPIDIPYSAGSFGATGVGTPAWTFPTGAANQVTFTAQQWAAELEIALVTTATTVSAATSVSGLLLTLPWSAASSRQEQAIVADLYLNGGATISPGVVVANGTGNLQIVQQSRGVFPLSGGNNYVAFKMRFQIQ
jgi:hypothetical protein